MTVSVPSFVVAPARGGVGESVPRPDAVPKVRGRFAYSSDLSAEGMLWGATVRSPHPRARIRAVDAGAALRSPGVRAVLTHDDVPGEKTYGLGVRDQPVLAWDEVRYAGEPVALVAADELEQAARAAELVHVEYEVLEPLVDPELALEPSAPRLDPSGNLIRHVRIQSGDPDARADVVVRGEYEVGMQDQAFLGPESGLAVPHDDGVDLYVSTQWLHSDQEQIAASLALPPEKVRVTLGGVGGAFGGKEDLSVQIHCCLLALATGRPVKMVYGREESFVGHVHRHPTRMRYEHGASRDGRLVYVRAHLVLDGGAYASSSDAVCSNVAAFACGPYEVPNVGVDALAVRTNNVPAGAMRGFGAVQVCFGYESQMDRLAEALGMDPLDLRILNAMGTGSRLPTGQGVRGPAPVAELLRRLRERPLPPTTPSRDPRGLPGGLFGVTRGEDVERGVGYAVGFKQLCYLEGFDDSATARVRLSAPAGEPLVEVHTAAVDVGQGVGVVQVQIARSELGVDRVELLPPDTSIGSAGSTSASRQTWMTGGAVKAACEAVRAEVVGRAAERLGEDPVDLRLAAGKVASVSGAEVGLAELLCDAAVEAVREYRHRPTSPLDPETGQGDAHVAYAFAAHRAVVDVDTALGLVRVVEIATTQDVGRAVNPCAVEGQIEGGTAQGLGLALMEEVRIEGGLIQNPSFTDYLVPTTLDVPGIVADVLELGDPDAPYGVKGAGEPPIVSSPAAVAAAVRRACGRPLTRLPVRPDDLVGPML